MTSVFRWVGLVFTAVGVLLLASVAILLYRDADFAAGADRAEGVVTELIRHAGSDSRSASSGISYTAVIAFSDKTGSRREMTDRISTNPPRFSTGDHVAVLYDPADPSNAVVDDFWGRKGIAAIMAAVSMPITILGVIFLAVERRSRRRIARLKQDARIVNADFLHVYRDDNISRKGEHPFRVVAQAADPLAGRLKRFESEPVWVDPSARLEGRQVRVLVDRRNAGNYHVDLSDVIE